MYVIPVSVIAVVVPDNTGGIMDDPVAVVVVKDDIEQ